MEQRISLVTLGVSNLAAQRAFYEALGWRVAHAPDGEDTFLQAGGMVSWLWAVLGETHHPKQVRHSPEGG